MKHKKFEFMSHALLGYATVGVAASSPPIILTFVSHFKRTSKVRVNRFQVNFFLWVCFAPFVELLAYFAATPESTKSAVDIFAWWIYTPLGLGFLILCVIAIMIAYKREYLLRTETEHAANTVGLTEFSGFVLNNAQSLRVIAAFVVAVGGGLLTIIGYCVASVLFVFIA